MVPQDKSYNLTCVNNMQADDSQVAILSFYSFITIKELDVLLKKMLLIGKRHLIRGTVLIAPEGFNGSIAGKLANLQLMVDEITKLTGATDVNIKINYALKQPFQKLRVKIKNEIISLATVDLDVEHLQKEYIESGKWDAFITQPDVVLIDTRNHYEISMGTYKLAINPNTDTFKQFPQWVAEHTYLLQDKKIAMCCTGGIRCEKAAAYLKKIGYHDVYQLKGGILQYLAETKNQNGLWQGVCFVFDDRRAVAADLSPADGYWLKRE